MTFKIHTVDDGRIPPFEKLPCAAIIPKVGMALYFASGRLTTASGANQATHICMEEHAAAVTAGRMIHVIKIQPDIVFESQLAAAGALVVGTAYEVATGGMTVAAATTNANFKLDYVGGAAAGDTVRGRFINLA